MLKRYRKSIGGLFRLSDSLWIAISWILAFQLRFYFPVIEVTKGIPSFEKHLTLLPLVVLVWLSVFSAMKLYQPKQMLRRTHEVQLAIKAHGIALLILVASLYIIEETKISRLVLIQFGLLSGIGLALGRVWGRNILRILHQRGRGQRRLLAVGEGQPLESFIYYINKFPELGIHVVGILTEPRSSVQTVQSHPVVGHFEALPQLIREKGIDEVLIALPRSQGHHLDPLLESIRRETVDVLLAPDVHEYVALGCEVEDFQGHPLVRLNESPLDAGWGALAKRITDIIIACIALVLVSPVLLVISLLIRLTSGSPVLFRQERMGLDGSIFNMIKFRTMQMDAESKTGPVWTTPKDSRVTGLGAFLRATSLDELPQFWNVLRGEMSLVGPRPERPVFVEKFREEHPRYMLRHKVKAGLTGWAQVNGWRGNTSVERRIEFDLYYIRNWSLMLDLKILLMTLWKGFIHKNAY